MPRQSKRKATDSPSSSPVDIDKLAQMMSGMKIEFKPISAPAAAAAAPKGIVKPKAIRPQPRRPVARPQPRRAAPVAAPKPKAKSKSPPPKPKGRSKSA